MRLLYSIGLLAPLAIVAAPMEALDMQRFADEWWCWCPYNWCRPDWCGERQTVSAPAVQTSLQTTLVTALQTHTATAITLVTDLQTQTSTAVTLVTDLQTQTSTAIIVITELQTQTATAVTTVTPATSPMVNTTINTSSSPTSSVEPRTTVEAQIATIHTSVSNIIVVEYRTQTETSSGITTVKPVTTIHPTVTLTHTATVLPSSTCVPQPTQLVCNPSFEFKENDAFPCWNSTPARIYADTKADWAFDGKNYVTLMPFFGHRPSLAQTIYHLHMNEEYVLRYHYDNAGTPKPGNGWFDVNPDCNATVTLALDTVEVQELDTFRLMPMEEGWRFREINFKPYTHSKELRFGLACAGSQPRGVELRLDMVTVTGWTSCKAQNTTAMPN